MNIYDIIAGLLLMVPEFAALVAVALVVIVVLASIVALVVDQLKREEKITPGDAGVWSGRLNMVVAVGLALLTALGVDAPVRDLLTEIGQMVPDIYSMAMVWVSLVGAVWLLLVGAANKVHHYLVKLGIGYSFPFDLEMKSAKVAKIRAKGSAVSNRAPPDEDVLDTAA